MTWGLGVGTEVAYLVEVSVLLLHMLDQVPLHSFLAGTGSSENLTPLLVFFLLVLEATVDLALQKGTVCLRGEKQMF